MKKVFALLLAVTMLLAMGTTALAMEEGSITLNNTEPGIEYNLYRIFDLTYSGSNVAYTISDKWTGFFAAGADGAKYIVENDTDPASLNPINVGDATKYINTTDANVATFANEAIA